MATDAHSQPEDRPSPEEAPSTDVEVKAHVHFGMTGSFPLRVADLFFADDGLYIAEYSFITPFFGLLSYKHKNEAEAMGAIFDRWGLDAVMVQADYIYWHSYDNIESVVIHEGGRFTRPKITVYPNEGESHAYRIHDRPQFEEAVADLETLADTFGFPLEYGSGLGIYPRENVRRFFER
ncbi:MAG: hypothetical protein ABEJ58_00785 [Halodesulfurarchaeum sp.]